MSVEDQHLSEAEKSEIEFLLNFFEAESPSGLPPRDRNNVDVVNLTQCIPRRNVVVKDDSADLDTLYV